MKIISDLIETFFPFRCHVCAELTNLGQVLCGGCTVKLANSLRKPFAVLDTICEIEIYALSEYDSFVADIIKLIKYRPSKRLIGHLRAVVLEKSLLNNFVAQTAIFVPVPMHKSRLKTRGFNQAELIADFMATISQNHFSPAIERIVATKPQAECDERERAENLDGAFSLCSGLIKEDFKGKEIVIIDDVATTGTTIEKCRMQLEKLRPAKISALVISHSFKRIIQKKDDVTPINSG